MDLSEPKQPGTSPADHERGPSDAAVRLSGSSARIGCGWTGARVRRIAVVLQEQFKNPLAESDLLPVRG